MKRRANDPIPETTWPEADYQLSVGSYAGLDDRVKSQRKKLPFGFVAPPKPRKRS